MTKDIKETHVDWMRQAIGSIDLPEEVMELYSKVKLAIDRISGGEMHPHVLVLIAVLGCEKAGINIEEPDDLNDGDDDDGDMSARLGFDWEKVPRGARIQANWHGVRTGKFIKVLPGKKLFVQLDDGTRRSIRTKRIELVDGEAALAASIEA